MMEKPSLILHIGSPKTGTSFIQESIINNESLLLDKGFLYPKSMRWHDGAHHKLAFALRGLGYAGNEMDFSEVLHCLDKELEVCNCSTVVISSEILFFFSNEEKIRQNFFHLFSRFNSVEVVVFLREPVSYLSSLYKQMIKDPNDALTESPDIFLKSNLEYLDYSSIINEYSSLGCSVRLLEYRRDINISNLFFNNVLGIDDHINNNNSNVNPTLDGPALKLKFYYNSLLPDYDINKMVTEHIISYQKILGIDIALDVFTEEDKDFIENEFVRINNKEHQINVNRSCGEHKFQPVSLEMISKFESYLSSVSPDLLEKINKYRF